MSVRAASPVVQISNIHGTGRNHEKDHATSIERSESSSGDFLISFLAGFFEMLATTEVHGLAGYILTLSGSLRKIAMLSVAGNKLDYLWNYLADSVAVRLCAISSGTRSNLCAVGQAMRLLTGQNSRIVQLRI